MKNFILWISIFFLFKPEIIQAIDVVKVKKSVVRLITKNYDGKFKSGTGFFITDNGWLVTNSHVVTDSLNNISDVFVLIGTQPLKKIDAHIQQKKAAKT